MIDSEERWQEFEEKAWRARSARLAQEHERGRHRSLVPRGPLPHDPYHSAPPWLAAARSVPE